MSVYDVIKLYYQQVKRQQNDLGMTVQVKIARFCSASDCLVALYDQETVRNSGQPSYSRLKTSVRLHIDQTMRTRNSRERNEIVERGAVTKRKESLR